MSEPPPGSGRPPPDRERPGRPTAPDGPGDPGRRRFLAWLWRIPVLAALGGAIYAGIEGSRILFRRETATETPEFEPVTPVTVAEASEFGREWEAVEFAVAGTPAIAVRLPEPASGGTSVGDLHLAAFSRVCTHQGCTVALNTDVEAIAFAFNYRGETPALTCPCHLSVFLPTLAGKAVSGPATEPLPRIRLDLADGTVRATGIERPKTSERELGSILRDESGARRPS